MPSTLMNLVEQAFGRCSSQIILSMTHRRGLHTQNIAPLATRRVAFINQSLDTVIWTLDHARSLYPTRKASGAKSPHHVV